MPSYFFKKHVQWYQVKRFYDETQPDFYRNLGERQGEKLSTSLFSIYMYTV